MALSNVGLLLPNFNKKIKKTIGKANVKISLFSGKIYIIDLNNFKCAT